MEKLIKIFGYHLFSITFENCTPSGDIIGMVTMTLYATSYGHARHKAVKKLDHQNIMFIGSWTVNIEII